MGFNEYQARVATERAAFDAFVEVSEQQIHALQVDELSRNAYLLVIDCVSNLHALAGEAQSVSTKLAESVLHQIYFSPELSQKNRVRFHYPIKQKKYGSFHTWSMACIGNLSADKLIERDRTRTQLNAYTVSPTGYDLLQSLRQGS